MKVAILFDNFGPYHQARLAAASAVAEVLGVEFGGSSHEYFWQRTAAKSSLRLTTLFPESSSRQVPPKAFRDRLAKVLNEFQPDAVAIPGWSGRGAFLALQWCVANRVPAVVMSESTASDEPRTGWREWVKRRYLALCSAALVGGQPHQDYLQLLGVKTERIFQGYDAVDNDYFAAKAREIRMTKLEPGAVRLPGDSDSQERPHSAGRSGSRLPQKFFLASARFIEKKNLSFLLHAFARYRELASLAPLHPSRSPSPVWDLVLLGDGDLRDSLKAKIDQLNLGEHVELPGFVQYADLPAYYASAGAFIHASTTEQWGLVVNEAMASGLPVLVSERCGCAHDLVRNGVNGFTFDPTDTDQLAELMKRIARDDEELATMGAASQKMIAEWSPARFASGLLSAAKVARLQGAPAAGFLDCLLLTFLARR